MEENGSKLAAHDNGANGAVEIIQAPLRMPVFDLSPHEPHLYDYLLILRKHQWLILTFLLTVVTIVSIAPFRMKLVYVAMARIEVDRENANFLPFQAADPYAYLLDQENYIETQSKILTSETLALQTIRSVGLGGHPDFSEGGKPSQAVTTGSLAHQNRPTEAQSDRMKKEALYQLAQSGSLDALPAVRDSELLQDIYKKRNDAYTQYTAALNQFGPNFPRVQRLQEQLKEFDGLIDAEKKNIVTSIENEYRAARQRELLLLKALDQQKAEANQMAERLVQYNILKREAEATKALYEGLLR